jgi:hypothetical protein
LKRPEPLAPAGARNDRIHQTLQLDYRLNNLARRLTDKGDLDNAAALADRDGIVESSIPGLANYAGVSIAETEAALQKFLSPDAYSRSPENDGRRVEPVDGGWRLLNYAKYRLRMSPEDVRERDRIRKQRQREQQKLSVKSGTKCDHPDNSAKSNKSIKQKTESNNQGAGDGIGRDAGECFDPSFDGSEAFGQLCECYPPNKVERGRYVQEAYTKAVFEVKMWKSLRTPEAADWLKSRATAYRSEKFPVGMQKWLEKEMYKQGAPAPVRFEPLIDRVRRQRGEIQ